MNSNKIMAGIAASVSTAALIAGLATTATFTTGCATVGTGTNGTALDTNKLERLAVVLKTAVSDAVLLAAEDRLPSTRSKILLAREIIEGLVNAETTSPNDIANALASQIKDAKPEVKIAVNTVIGLYEVYYGDYIRGVIGQNTYAARLLRAAVEGIDRGLALAPTPGPIPVP